MAAYPDQPGPDQRRAPPRAPSPPQRQAPQPDTSFDDHPLMRKTRLQTLGTATSIVLAVELLVFFLWMMDSIWNSGGHLSPFYFPIQSWIFIFWLMCTVINISLMALHVIRLRWTPDEREALWNISNYSTGVRIIVVLAVILLVLFGYPPLMKAVNDNLHPTEGRPDVTDFAYEFTSGDALNIHSTYKVEVIAEHPINVSIHTEADVDAHPEFDGTPVYSRTNISHFVYEDTLDYGTYFIHMVADNDTQVNYTIYKRVDPSFIATFFWFPLVLLIANVCYAVVLFIEHRRAIRSYVTKEQAKLQKAFSIEEVFLIYRDGRLIAHNTRRLKADVDKDIMTGMLTAVQNFVADSFKKDEDGILDEMHYGNLRVIIENGPFANMAVVINGPEPKDIRQRMKNILGEIHQLYGPVLSQWDGNTTDMLDCKRILGEITPLPPQNIRKDPVEEVFVFHRDSRFIMHVTQRLGPDVDDELLKETVEYIQQKVSDAMQYNPTTVPKVIPYGDWAVILEYGPDAYIAAMLSGAEPRGLRQELETVLEEIHLDFGQVLYNWDGDTESVKDIRKKLEAMFIKMRMMRRPG